jgi:hypothetical protein
MKKEIILTAEQNRVIQIALNEFRQSINETIIKKDCPTVVRQVLNKHLETIEEIRTLFLNQYTIISNPIKY